MSEKRLIMDGLESSQFFDQLSHGQLERLAHSVLIKTLEKGEAFYRQNEVPLGVFMLKSGKMRFTISNPEGQEMLLSYCSKGLWFGYPEVIISQSAAATALATERSEIFVINADAFLDVIKRNADVLYALTVQLSYNHHVLTQVLSRTTLKGLEYRLARLCIMICFYSGYRADLSNSFTLEITQEELGLSVAASRQSINKTLKKWVEAELVEIGSKKITILDVEKMRAKLR